ncbi:MAG: M20/M25/M40 family metallo-hydrolase [Planctomycetota bacterium]
MIPASPEQLLLELVAIESPSGAEHHIADYVSQVLRAWKLDVERLGNTTVATLERGRGPKLLLNTHVDTVPIGAGWTRNPLGGSWEGECLYGRGANDAKVSVAAMMWAMRESLEGRIPDGTVQLALTEGEETTHAGITKVIERLGLPDGAVTGEPTGLQVVRAQSGLAVLSAVWHGSSCHAAHVARVPHENALLAAASEISQTAPWIALDGTHPLLGASTITATVLHAGERHNVVPDRAEALFDARLSPLHSAGDAEAVLRRRLPRAEVSVKSARLRPFETAAGHPLVRAALAAAGRENAIGSSTMSDLALLQGVPSIKCGPGETARSHTPDEFVNRSELLAGTVFYTRFVPLALEALVAVPEHVSCPVRRTRKTL